MQTSTAGEAALVLEEGEVLKAYRDVVGKLTIGVGLTDASGVVKVKPGMTITKAESRRLLGLALRRNYEPAVQKAMTGAGQNEFDAAVSFHFNTGAIGRASWVGLWRARAARDAISAKFRLWNKGGGKVLPALSKRRERELSMLFDGKYSVPTNEPTRGSVSLARWVLVLDLPEKVAALVAFARLGYAVGIDPAAVPAAEIRRFQGDHDLTQDGKIGRATLSTLQRRIDASDQAKTAALVSAGTGGSFAIDASQQDLLSTLASGPWVWGAVAAALALWAAIITWRYRDVVAAKINRRAPRAAAFMRSF